MFTQRTKKNIAWSTAAVISLSVLAACGSNAANEPKAEAPAPAPAAGGETKPEPRGKISVSIYDRGLIPAEEGTYSDNRWTRWINENGPVDVEFVQIPRNESQQKYSMLFASGEAPDLVLEYDNAFVNTLWAQKQLLPLDDLIAEHSTEYKKLLEKFPELKKLATKPDGKCTKSPGS